MAPHVGQKRKVAELPLSPVRTHSVACPEMVTRSLGKRACAPKVLPVRRWQARQWHMDTRTGSPRAMATSCPQLQVARRLPPGAASGRASVGSAMRGSVPRLAAQVAGGATVAAVRPPSRMARTPMTED